jgi:hypothetical protein
MGRRILEDVWPEIVNWLNEPLPSAVLTQAVAN